MPEFRALQTQPDLHQLRQEAKQVFGHLAGVKGFGVGNEMLHIYVRDNSVVTDQRLPSTFGGVPVNYVVIGRVVGR